MKVRVTTNERLDDGRVSRLDLVSESSSEGEASERSRRGEIPLHANETPPPVGRGSGCSQRSPSPSFIVQFSLSRDDDVFIVNKDSLKAADTHLFR